MNTCCFQKRARIWTGLSPVPTQQQAPAKPLLSERRTRAQVRHRSGRSPSCVQHKRLDPVTPEHLAAAVNKSTDELSLSVDDSLSAAPLRVAYQGVPGAYSEMAALKAEPLGEPYPCAQFETAFQTVSQWMADRAVLPVENSLGGSIHTVYDLLLRYRLHIVGETSIAVDHCLLALPGVKSEDLKRIISHPQALAQCDGYLRRMGVVREAVDDTAGAAMQIAKEGWRDTGAIASSRAAQLYGMDCLDKSIQDNKVQALAIDLSANFVIQCKHVLTPAVLHRTM